jgi:protein-L-isoaspartate(D-aspartate) O-methyltransferase
MRAADLRSELLRGLARQVGERVTEAVGLVPREVFVTADMRDHAWEDRALPIGAGQTISQPSLVAKMCELLELHGDERVLDIGTGSGYHAAVLSRLCAHVYSIERHESLSAQAYRNLAAADIANVTLLVGDGTHGHPEQAPYNAINVAAASSGGVPAALEEQLAPNGRLVVPVDGADQRLLLIRRRDGKLERSEVVPVRFVPLISDDAEQQLARTFVDLVE